MFNLCVSRFGHNDLSVSDADIGLIFSLVHNLMYVTKCPEKLFFYPSFGIVRYQLARCLRLADLQGHSGRSRHCHWCHQAMFHFYGFKSEAESIIETAQRAPE